MTDIPPNYIPNPGIMHHTYMGRSETVCQRPGWLNTHLLAYWPHEKSTHLRIHSCKKCLEIVAAYNEQQAAIERREWLSKLDGSKISVLQPPRNPDQAYWAGLFLGILVGIMLLAIVWGLVWLVQS